MRACLLIICYYLISGAVKADTSDKSDNLAKGQELLAQGQYFQAIKELELAVQNSDTSAQKTLATGALGLTHYQLHHDRQAEDLLRNALALGNGNRHEQARWHTLLGSLLLNQGKADEAQRHFSSALALAGDNQELRSGIELQQIDLLPLFERLPKLAEIHKRLLPLKPGTVRSSYLVRLASLAYKLKPEGRTLTYQSLIEAKVSAPPRLLAEIFGELAQLYEDDQRYDEAFQLNHDALKTIKGVDAPDLLLEMEWRQGRLFRIRQQIPEAIAAYQRSIDHIESIRHDIPLSYRGGQSSFRSMLEPLYQQMADLLLGQANAQGEAGQMMMLRRARNVIELVKQAELEDFLGGRCAIQPTRSALLEAIEPKTAIIYPIILPDRLELLISTGNEIQQYTQQVSAKTLQSAVLKSVAALRSGHPYAKEFSATLYQWLIAPLESYLQKHQVQTLVIVPDTVLRLMPFAVLHDGKSFLIERYALGTSPGLSIIEPRPFHPHQVKSLIVGLSEPGNVIDHLPGDIINEIGLSNIQVHSEKTTNRSRALTMSSVEDTTGQSPPATQTNINLRDEKIRQKIKEALSLPGVVTEIENLKPAISGTVLLNESFKVENFKQELLNEPYAIIHIASHLITGSNSESSFIMAYDNVINFDQLDSLLRSGKFANQPLEMLTLSACQTAEGDDRAPLGLSGLAVKAKVRSALGTLWPANDEAASVLMVEFYKALNKPGISKAQALRQAQLKLLNDNKLQHPFFWAPYILVGNWL
jgi:CHAT domain-containing protein